MELQRIDYTLWGGNLPVNTPSDWQAPVPSTGTVDDEDEPEDEDENENEIPVRAPSEAMEAPEEFATFAKSRGWKNLAEDFDE